MKRYYAGQSRELPVSRVEVERTLLYTLLVTTLVILVQASTVWKVMNGLQNKEYDIFVKLAAHYCWEVDRELKHYQSTNDNLLFVVTERLIHPGNLVQMRLVGLCRPKKINMCARKERKRALNQG